MTNGLWRRCGAVAGDPAYIYNLTRLQALLVLLNDFRRSGLPCHTLCVHRSRIGIRIQNHQELSHRKATTRTQGNPVFRKSLPAVVDAVEAVRGLEETIRDVYSTFRHRFRS